MKQHQNRIVIENMGQAFREGMRDGVPIGLGYLAVSFSLGIAAKNAGLTPFQAFLASLLCNASAGEYAGFTTIAAHAAFLEIALVTLIANARYLLMSCAMSQRMYPGISVWHRLFMAFDITDELFGIAISRPGYLNPYYTYGAVLTAAPCWAFGTALGTVAGNLLPLRLVSAFSVALYGMFLAVIIPPARKDRIVAGLVLLCFLASFGASRLPGLSELSEGTRTILLTVILAAGAALLFPRPAEPGEEESAVEKSVVKASGTKEFAAEKSVDEALKAKTSAVGASVAEEFAAEKSAAEASGTKKFAAGKSVAEEFADASISGRQERGEEK